MTFGVLAKERCTGDVAKRTGNEYQFQELARANIEDFTAAGVRFVRITISAVPYDHAPAINEVRFYSAE